MKNIKLKSLLTILLLSLITTNTACTKSQKINSNQSTSFKEKKVSDEKSKEKFKILTVEDITKLFSTDKYGFVFEKITLENKEIHYIGKSKDPECYGLLDVSGNDKLKFLKYSMALSEDDKINDNSFKKMESLINTICPSFKDSYNWLNEGKNNITSSKGVKFTEAKSNGMNIKFYEDEETRCWVLTIKQA